MSTTRFSHRLGPPLDPPMLVIRMCRLAELCKNPQTKEPKRAMHVEVKAIVLEHICDFAKHIS